MTAFSPARAAGFFDQFIDTEDGWFDGSDWFIENAYGFLPVPIIITEPAVGEGIGLAGVFIHADKDAPLRDESGNFTRPSISAVAGAVTNNDTWFVGGGHLGVWKDDHIRYLGGGGYASINLKFFGTAGREESDQQSDGLSFNGEGLFVVQNIRFRIGESPLFIGPQYQYLNVDNKFDLGLDIPFIDPPEFNVQTSGLGLIAEFDTRDSNFTPNRGTFAQLDFYAFDKGIGSDFDYQVYTGKYRTFLDLAKTLTLGLRLDGQIANGDIPFFAVPFIDLRGIPVLRYQGETVITAETEARWEFHPRFSAVGFVGAGRAAADFGKISDAPSRVSKGLGFRYLMARKLSLRAGIDIAWGPEERVWYLSIGQSWQ
jgi:hypothetical protein